MGWFANLGTSAIQYAVPTAGSTVTCTSGIGMLTLVLEPAGLLATLTVALPTNPVDGQSVRIATTQAVTALTITGGTMGIALGSLTALGSVIRTYSATQNKWY